MPERPTTDHVELLATSRDLIELLRTSSMLAASMKRAIDPSALLGGLAKLARVDEFATLAVIESLAELRHTEADRRLLGYLDHDATLIRRHAAWRLRHRTPVEAAYRPLVGQITAGGIETMHAHRTLRRWAGDDQVGVNTVVVDELDRSTSPAARARLVDLLGVLDGTTADRMLVRVANDVAESIPARIAAVGALSRRPTAGPEPTLRALAAVDDELGAHAAVAIDDLESSAAGRPTARSGRGLRIAQLTVTGELDRLLSRGGRGDTGGVASLLVSVGAALGARDDVDHVLTIGRGSLTDVVADQLLPDDGNLSYGTIVVGDEARADDPATLWEHLPTIERGIARVLRNRVAVDVLHLRMADVGTLAGVAVAEELGIETCFSLAGDPHNVIHSMQAQGRLDRASFMEASTADNFWFRARMVERLARETPQLALFPRSGHGLVDAGSIGTVGSERRSIVVPEGIDLRLVRTAERSVRNRVVGPSSPPDVLADLAAQIPSERRQLPLLVSVGRLNPIKGMDRVAEAWASDPALYRSSTLVIVGGSLVDPTPTELAVLASIDRAVPRHHPARAGLVLLGGRPRSDVALVLAAASAGLAGAWASGGAYVDGAAKEEFGLAVLEAMAAGLVVVAPNAGGPPTYVEHGVTGVLVDPFDDLAPALGQAFALVDEPGRAERATQLVEERYSIETMADRLVELYRPEPALL